ncbi:MAG TPA: hypothetical protein VIP11_02725 [Gemmatimonadaceae bacterium]
MRRLLILALACASPLAAQNPSPPRDPAAALVVTSDIANFWKAYDRAQASTDAKSRTRAYLDLYIRPGSPGLRDWVHSRLASGPGLVNLLVEKGWSRERIQSASTVPLTSAERERLTRDTTGVGDDLLAAMNLDAAVQQRPKFFAAIRANTLAIDTARAVKDSIRTYYRRLAALYPDAVFPPVYFLIGQLTSGGTTGPAGQLIGAEFFGTDSQTPLGELNAFERGVIGRVDGLPGIVAHEVIHIQQSQARGEGAVVETQQKKTLLAQSLDEGCASFLSWTITGADPAKAANQYGIAHERELWVEFQREMNGMDVSNWLYQGDRAKDRPADLGYFMGARICEAYFKNASDKRQAVRDMVAMRNPSAFRARSAYSP